jgi:hypothetical protein
MAEDQFWKDAYFKVRQQLTELRGERDERTLELADINQEILQLEELELRLAPFVETEPVKISLSSDIIGLGLSESLRSILKQSAPQYRTARGLRDSLDAAGYPLKQMHNNPLASIHGVLKRFVEAGSVEVVEKDGKSRFRWVDKPERPITGFSGLARPRVDAALAAETRDLEALAKRMKKN